MDSQKVEKLQEKRWDLESRAESILKAVCETPASSFRDWLTEALIRSPYKQVVGSALGLPNDKLDMIVLTIGSGDPFSNVVTRTIGRRTYYFLRVLLEASSHSLAPKAWGLLNGPLQSRMSFCRQFLPQREVNWQMLKGESKKPIAEIDFSRFTDAVYDPTLWVVLKQISSGSAGTSKDDWLFVLKFLNYYLTKHNFADISNKWWAFERYYFFVLKMMSNSCEKPESYKEVCAELLSFVDNPLSLCEPDQELATFSFTPEIFAKERSLLFAAFHSMKLLTNPLLAQDSSMDHLQEKLGELVLKAEDTILSFDDNDHLWWICQKLLMVYEIIAYEARTEIFKLLHEGVLDLKTNRIGDFVYSPLFKQKIEDVAIRIQEVLKNDPKAKNYRLVTMILGGSGIGKTSIVKSICQCIGNETISLADFEEKMLQKLSTQEDVETFLSCKSPKEVGKRYPRFIDEFHTRMNYNQYTAVHYVLSEGRSALPFFASSNYLNAEEFKQLAAKNAHEITHMVDFATRVANWIELPTLEYSSAHRTLVFMANKKRPDKAMAFNKRELAFVALNFRDWKNARDLQNLELHDISVALTRVEKSTSSQDEQMNVWLQNFVGQVTVSG
jgi:hypothetical protein